ncbi:hypothetical protein GCM10027567_32740 [Spongiibacter taiwanensis]
MAPALGVEAKKAPLCVAPRLFGVTKLLSSRPGEARVIGAFLASTVTIQLVLTGPKQSATDWAGQK